MTDDAKTKPMKAQRKPKLDHEKVLERARQLRESNPTLDHVESAVQALCEALSG